METSLRLSGEHAHFHKMGWSARCRAMTLIRGSLSKALPRNVVYRSCARVAVPATFREKSTHSGINFHVHTTVDIHIRRAGNAEAHHGLIIIIIGYLSLTNGECPFQNRLELMERVTFYWVHDARSFIDILLSVAPTTRPNRFRSLLIFNSMFTNVFKSTLVRDPFHHQLSHRMFDQRVFKWKKYSFNSCRRQWRSKSAVCLGETFFNHLILRIVSVFQLKVAHVGHLNSLCENRWNFHGIEYPKSIDWPQALPHFLSIELNYTFAKEKNAKKI